VTGEFYLHVNIPWQKGTGCLRSEIKNFSILSVILSFVEHEPMVDALYVNGDERSSEFGQNETSRKVLSFIFTPRRVFYEMQRLGSERCAISMRVVQIIPVSPQCNI